MSLDAIRRPAVTILMVLADSGTSALDAASRALAAPECVELIILDNASTDGIPQRLIALGEMDSRLRVVSMGSNFGFGVAMNHGAAIASGDWLLLLNPDCQLETDTLTRMLEVASDGAMVGAVVCDTDGRHDPAAWRRAPTVIRVLCTMTGLARLESYWRVFAGVNRRDALPVSAVPAEVVSGAIMLLPRGAFAAIGGFDAGYFLHFEDVDLCARIRSAGIPLTMAGSIRVLHAKGGSSSGRGLMVARHKHRGLLRYLRLHDPRARRWPWRVLLPMLVWFHFFLQIPALMLRDARARRWGAMPGRGAT